MTEQIHWECRDVARDPNLPLEVRTFEMSASIADRRTGVRHYITSRFNGRDSEHAILLYAIVSATRLETIVGLPAIRTITAEGKLL